MDSRLSLECNNEWFVTQYVTDLTTVNSVLDLILSRNPNKVDNVQVNDSFHTSDHKLLSYNLNIAKETEYSTEIRYDYKRMNTNGAREELRMIEWDKVLNGTANENWEWLKDILFRVQRKYVLAVTRNSKGKKMWLTYKAIKYVKSRIGYLENTRIRTILLV